MRTHDLFFFVCSDHFFVCSVHFLFAAFTFLFAVITFLFAAFTFLFAAIVFCLQRFFFFAASPLWAIVVYRVRSHPNAWHLKTFQWHGWTWFSNNSTFQSAKRSNRDTKKIFTGHGLRISKCPAVWYFSIFLFEKYHFLVEIFYLHLESSSASRKWKKFNVVLAQNNKPSTKRDIFFKLIM